MVRIRMQEPDGSDAVRALRQARLWAATMCLLHGVTMFGMWLLFATAFSRGGGTFIEQEPFAPSAAAEGAIWTLSRGWVLLLLLPIDFDILFRLARSGRSGLRFARQFSYAVFAGLLVLPILVGPELMTSLVDFLQRIDAERS
jgi:hypothetical protein